MLAEYTTRIGNKIFFILPTDWIYTFRNILRINSDYCIDSKVCLYNKDTIKFSVKQGLNSLIKFILNCHVSSSQLPHSPRSLVSIPGQFW